MVMGHLYTQRPVVTQHELRTQLELLLTADIRAGPDGEPSSSQFLKASRLVDQVLELIDRYTEGRVAGG